MKILASTFIVFLFAATSWATDLSTATLKQLVTERPDLVEDIKAGKDEGTSIITVIKDAQGRMSIWVSERRDMDGKLIEKLKDTYAYYQTGEINTITQEKYNGKLVLTSKKKLKHYRDGSQPDVENIAVGIPKF